MRTTVKRTRNTGFTTIELVTVLAIIAMLVAILLPAVTAVKSMAKEAKQQAQFVAIGAGLTAFRNDYGDYPPSVVDDTTTNYGGAQKLCEAMLGWDLMGFHPDSEFRSDGQTAAGRYIYNPDPDPATNSEMAKRKGRYLEMDNTTAFRLGDVVYNSTEAASYTDVDRFVLCDVYGVKRVVIPNSAPVKAGTPILYYRANPSLPTIQEKYNTRDNSLVVGLGRITDGREHPMLDDNVFYERITDWKLPNADTNPYPHRPDSYILISAGPDSLYGTADDITNFDK